MTVRAILLSCLSMLVLSAAASDSLIDDAAESLIDSSAMRRTQPLTDMIEDPTSDACDTPRIPDMPSQLSRGTVVAECSPDEMKSRTQCSSFGDPHYSIMRGAYGSVARQALTFDSQTRGFNYLARFNTGVNGYVFEMQQANEPWIGNPHATVSMAYAINLPTRHALVMWGKDVYYKCHPIAYAADGSYTLTFEGGWVKVLKRGGQTGKFMRLARSPEDLPLITFSITTSQGPIDGQIRRVWAGRSFGNTYYMDAYVHGSTCHFKSAFGACGAMYNTVAYSQCNNPSARSRVAVYPLEKNLFTCPPKSAAGAAANVYYNQLKARVEPPQKVPQLVCPPAAYQARYNACDKELKAIARNQAITPRCPILYFAHICAKDVCVNGNSVGVIDSAWAAWVSADNAPVCPTQ